MDSKGKVNILICHLLFKFCQSEAQICDNVIRRCNLPENRFIVHPAIILS